MLPTLAGNGGKVVVINPGGTAMTVTVGTLALAGNLSTTGAFNTVFAQSASITITLPGVAGTLATLAGTETLTNKTLVAPALGTPISGVATNLTGTATALNIGGNAATATTATTATNQSGGTVAATTLSASGAVTGAGFTARFSSPGAIGDVSASTGAFTTLSATSTIAGAGFTARFATPGPIGNTSASTGAFTTISATGQITSTVSTGTAPLVIASTTNVANLNASSLSGATFSAPGAIGGGTPGAGAFTTLSATSTITPSQTVGIVGTTTNNNVQAGSVGEYISVSVLLGAAVALTSGVNKDVAVMTLTPGDWMVSGNIIFSLAAAASICTVAVSTVINSIPTLGSENCVTQMVTTMSSGVILSAGPMRANLGISTDLHLVGQATSGGAIGAYGFMGARRVR